MKIPSKRFTNDVDLNLRNIVLISIWIIGTLIIFGGYFAQKQALNKAHGKCKEDHHLLKQ